MSMDNIYKMLAENELLNDETRDRLKEAFKATLESIKSEQEAAIRQEMVNRYEQDRKTLEEATEKFISGATEEAVAEFKEATEAAEKIRLEYANKIAEIKEAAQGYVKDRMRAAEGFIKETVNRELAELHSDVKASRKAYLNAISEANSREVEREAEFKKKAAHVLEHIINTHVHDIMESYKNEINSAYQSDFGREIFESFYTTFRRHFFNSDKEFRNLVVRLKESENKLEQVESEMSTKLTEATRRADAATKKLRVLSETSAREKQINHLVSKLKGSSATKMRSLLESAPANAKVDDINRMYTRFLPDVLTEADSKPMSEKSSKVKQNVAKLRTGGAKIVKESHGDDDFEEINSIKRRAGVKN